MSHCNETAPKNRDMASSNQQCFQLDHPPSFDTRSEQQALSALAKHVPSKPPLRRHTSDELYAEDWEPAHSQPVNSQSQQPAESDLEITPIEHQIVGNAPQIVDSQSRFKEAPHQPQNHLDRRVLNDAGTQPILGAGYPVPLEVVHKDRPLRPRAVFHGNRQNNEVAESGQPWSPEQDPYLRPWQECSPDMIIPSMNPEYFWACLEQNLCVPIPTTWGVLPPVLRTYYGTISTLNTSGWIDVPSRQDYFLTPRSRRYQGELPIFRIEGEQRTSWGRHIIDWLMSGRIDPQTTVTWAFERKTSSRDFKLKSETLVYNNGPMITFTFSHGTPGQPGEYDCLSFRMLDGSKFEWRSNMPISTIKLWRYDFQRYALFRLTQRSQTTNEIMPEVLVADATHWNGHFDDFPGTVYIRSPDLQEGMVIATLQVLLSQQWEVLRDEVRKNLTMFQRVELRARGWESGMLAYWKPDDMTRNGSTTGRFGGLARRLL